MKIRIIGGTGNISQSIVRLLLEHADIGTCQAAVQAFKGFG